MIIRDRHTAVGWVETIYVSQNLNADTLSTLDYMLGQIEQYPILSESHWTELVCNEIYEYWRRCSLGERVDYCKENDTSIFAARQDYPPDKVYDTLSDTWQ